MAHIPGHQGPGLLAPTSPVVDPERGLLLQLLERMKPAGSIARGLLDFGADFLPGIGEVRSAGDVVRDVRGGDIGLGTLLSLAGTVPGIPGGVRHLRRVGNPRGIARQIERENPGLALSMFEVRGSGGPVWELNSIVVPKGQRKQGIGSKVMKRITDEADRAGATLTLDPSTDFGATSVSRLRRFYSRFGFSRNTGRTADHSLSGAMLRRPTEGS